MIIIYATRTCPKCKLIGSQFDGNDVKYTIEYVGENITKEQLEELVGRTVRSVPVVVQDGKEIMVNTEQTENDKCQ